MMKTIVIAGSGSGCGKTTLAVKLIGMLPGWAAIKVSPSDLYTVVVDDPAVINEPGKDTALMAAAGAAHVVWVQSSMPELKETLPLAMNLAGDVPGVVIEGNAAADVIEPDTLIFVLGPDLKIKPGAERLLERADIVVVNAEEMPEGAKEQVQLHNNKAKILLIKEEIPTFF